MTGHAVVRDLPVLMTFHAKTHRVVHDAFGHGHVLDVSVTGRTFHVVPNVGSVIETDMRHCRKAIHALPGNFFASNLVVDDLLDLFLRVRRLAFDGVVTSHTGVDAGNAGHWSFIDAHMAEVALQPRTLL